MKKRGFITALLAAYVLLLCAAALAGDSDTDYKIDYVISPYAAVYSTDLKVGYRVNVVIRTRLQKTFGEALTRSPDRIVWTISDDNNVLVRSKLVSIDNESVSYT